MAAASAAAGVLRRRRSGIAADQAVAAGDDAADRDTGFGVVGKSRLAHALLDFEVLFGLVGRRWNRFVNVCCHKAIIDAGQPWHSSPFAETATISVAKNP